MLIQWINRSGSIASSASKCLVKTPFKAFKPVIQRGISQTLKRRNESGLVGILKEEIEYETGQLADMETQQSPIDYVKKNFKVRDEPGKREVELYKKQGDVEILVKFSAHTPENEEPLNEDLEEFEENEDVSEYDDAMITVTPVEVILTKMGKLESAIVASLLASEEKLVIQNISFLPNSKFVLSRDISTQFERDLYYEGYPFNDLNEGLQEEWRKYFENFGINSDFAASIAQYSHVKGENEYRTWLENLKTFVEA